MIYELREYVAVPGHADDVHTRFDKHTLNLFDRNGLDVVGFWNDTDDPHRIVYLMRFADDATRTEAWARFQSDPDWQRVKAESEASGPIVAQMTSRTLSTPPYWTRDTIAAHDN